MEIQRESLQTPENDGMDPITSLVDGIMEQIQDSPGSTNVPLSQNVHGKVGGIDSCTSVTSKELNVVSTLLTDSILEEIKATNVPLSKNVDKKVGGIESITSITSEELNVVSTLLTDSVLEEIKATSVPLSQNVDEKVGGIESITSITSEELNVVSSQLTDYVLDEIKATFGQKEENQKSTTTGRIPIIFKITVKKLPAKAPAKEPSCTADKMKKKKDQILGFFSRSWKTMKRIFTRRSNRVSPA
ncbi:uncharacterized protein LOC134317788 [Trichomycterus rosablanca]|uniref:uncharacterized protein LOC134317788 n=1 Tax=Trichomycterus rosablanca TaxID=2290929 RepID=UPI002F3519C2